MVLAYDNGTIAIYDWNNDKVIDEKDDFGMVKCMGISNQGVNKNERMLAMGNDNGELTLLKRK